MIIELFPTVPVFAQRLASHERGRQASANNMVPHVFDCTSLGAFESANPNSHQNVWNFGRHTSEKSVRGTRGTMPPKIEDRELRKESAPSQLKESGREQAAAS
jgi:hypothetical protein